MTTRHLFLIFPAYLLAVAWAEWLDSCRLPNYHFAAAANDVRQFHLQVQYADDIDQNNVINADVVNQWFEQSLPAGHSAWRLLVEKPCLDRWGNPYRCVQNVTTDAGSHSALGVYSTGRDGESKTNGNDPDDLNSWNEYPDKFYRAELRSADRKEFAIQGAWLTPFTYAGLLIVVAGWKRFSRRTDFRD
jgi:hypothetical protein